MRSSSPASPDGNGASPPSSASIAERQRARAETTLAAATRTTDTLIFDLAQEFRRRTGMPVDLIRLILERVQGLQRQLAEAGERTSDLLRLESGRSTSWPRSISIRAT